MPGSKQTQTQTATKDPWGPAQPALSQILTQAQQFGGDPSRFTPTFSADTNAGIAGMSNLAQQPGQAQQYLPEIVNQSGAGFGTGFNTLNQTASGGMLGQNNPYLDQVLDTAKSRAADSVNQHFSGVGRYGSTQHAQALGDRLGAIETNARMQNYDAERARQLQASGVLHGAGFQGAGMAGMLDQANLGQQQLRLQAGQMQDAQEASVRQAPLAATQWMNQMTTPIASLGGTSSGTTTTSTPANIPGMVLGGLQMGAGLMTGNPMAAFGGASALGGSYMPGTAANGGWSTRVAQASPWGGMNWGGLG